VAKRPRRPWLVDKNGKELEASANPGYLAARKRRNSARFPAPRWQSRTCQCLRSSAKAITGHRTKSRADLGMSAFSAIGPIRALWATAIRKQAACAAYGRGGCLRDRSCVGLNASIVTGLFCCICDSFMERSITDGPSRDQLLSIQRALRQAAKPRCTKSRGANQCRKIDLPSEI
jgi:hypothetical protein